MQFPALSHESELKHYLGCLYESERYRGKTVNTLLALAPAPAGMKHTVEAVLRPVRGLLSKAFPPAAARH
jgi:hypothetical protein